MHSEILKIYKQKLKYLNMKTTKENKKDIEQKAEHIWQLIKAAQKAGIKTYICLPNYLNN